MSGSFRRSWVSAGRRCVRLSQRREPPQQTANDLIQGPLRENSELGLPALHPGGSCGKRLASDGAVRRPWKLVKKTDKLKKWGTHFGEVVLS